MTTGFIGTGNMALALAHAVSDSGIVDSIVGYDVRPEQLDLFARELPAFTAAADNRDVVRRSQVVFLSVKPQHLDEILAETAEASVLVVSIIAGIRLSRLEAAMPRARVVRVMPNTPALVGAMAAGYSLGSRVTDSDAETVAALLSSAGTAIRVDEELLDAVTGLSGSGPAFVARLIDAFADAGESLGLDRAVALELTLATFEGTAKLIRERGLSPEQLVEMVSSPGGTTIAGRRVLEGSGYVDVIRRTIVTAAERSRELGE